MKNEFLELCKEIVKNENKTCYEICEKYSSKICCSDCPLQPTPSCDCLSGQHIMLAKQYIEDHTLNNDKEAKITITWEDFKEGKIAIHTPTRENFIEFNKLCKEKIDDYLEDFYWNYRKENTCINFYEKMRYTDMEWYIENGYKIIEFNDFICREDIKMEKTFREVIADIKDGEIWESRILKIFIEYGCVKIHFNDENIRIKDDDIGIRINEKDKFKLQRKEYTFEEAFNSKEIAKEIESLVSGIKYKKYNENTMMFKDKDMDDFAGISNDNAIFSIDEINGKWYINK